jgi:hypothetical protein
MALSLQQISDRIEVEDLLERYTSCIDAKDWDGLDSVFAPDAILDYSSSGGPPAGPYPEIKAWLERALAIFPMTQHMIGKSRIKIDGDTAQCRSIFYNPMGMPTDADGKFTMDIDGRAGLHTFVVGGFYNDTCKRTPDGWRIVKKVEEQAYLTGGFAPGFDVPA